MSPPVRAAVSLLIVAAAAWSPSPSQAQEAEPAAARVQPRDVPDYDGRGPEPTTAGEALLWVPRVAVSPLYLTTEYLLRRPLGAMVIQAERAQLAAKVVEFFTFGPDDQFFLVPTFSYDFGFRPNVGLYFAWDDALHPANQVRATVAFGGIDWVSATFADRIEPSGVGWSFGARYHVEKRADGLFYGIGSEARERNQARYRWERHEGELTASEDLWRQSRVALTMGVRAAYFDATDGRCRSLPSRVSPPEHCLDQEPRFDALPPGFEEGFVVWHQGAEVILDTRRTIPDAGSGFRLRAAFDLAFDLENGAEERLWATYGLAAGGFVDVTGNNHVLSLTLSTAFADAMAGEVPFTELPDLSGDGPMRGFRGETVTGESTLALTLAYHWPVWFWLDGTLHASLGNAFDGHLEDFAPEDLRLSFGLGLAAVTSRDHFFELLLGFGTDTLGNGPDVDSIRVLFGGTREF